MYGDAQSMVISTGIAEARASGRYPRSLLVCRAALQRPDDGAHGITNTC